MTAEPDQPRFLTMAQVADELNVKQSLVQGLIRTGELRAFQVRGRGYLVRLLRWMRFVAAFTGHERRRQRELSARYVRMVERRCAVVGE